MYRTEILKNVRKERVLHEVSLELTYACNLDCFFCYNDRKKPGTELSLEQYKTLLDDLAEMQTLYIMLTGGEPMVHPDFFKIGAHAKKLGFVTRVRTNGHSLTAKNVARLRDEVDPFCVEVSLHGATAQSHDRQTRIAGSFDKLTRNIVTARQGGLNVSVVSTPTKWNEHELNEMAALCDSLGVPLRFQGPVAPRDDGDLTPLEISPTAAAWDKAELLQNPELDSVPSSRPVAEISVGAIGKVGKDGRIEKLRNTTKPEPNSVDQTVLDLDEEPKATCSVGVAGVDIDPFGNVQACMHLQASAGNLHDHSIKDIWATSPLFVEARNRAIEAAKQFENSEPRQMGAKLYCLAVEENLSKSGEWRSD